MKFFAIVCVSQIFYDNVTCHKETTIVNFITRKYTFYQLLGVWNHIINLYIDPKS